MRATVIAALLLSAWLGARALNADPIWYDEYRSFYYAGWGTEGTATLTGTLNRVGGSDVQAPGYFLLLNAWGAAAGRTPFAGRVFSWLWGVLAVAAAYRLGRDLAGDRAGLAAALTLTVSAFYVNYTHEIRTYSLLVLCATLAADTYWRLWWRPSRTDVALFTLGLGALPYLHYVGALIFPALGLFHLASVRAWPRRRWWTVTGMATLAALAFAPWLRVAYTAAASRASGGPGIADTLGLWGTLRETMTLYSNNNTMLLLIVILLALLAARTSRAARYIITLVALLLLTIGLFDTAVPTLFHPRYLLLVWGPLAGLAGVGVAYLSARGVPLALTLGVWVLLGSAASTDAAFYENVHGPGAYAPWDRTADALASLASPDDLVAMHLPPLTIYEPYHEPVARYYLGELGVASTGVESLRLMPDADYIARGTSRMAGYERVWLVMDPRTAPERNGVFSRAITGEGGGFVACPPPDASAVVRQPGFRAELYVPTYTYEDDPAATFNGEIRAFPLTDLATANGNTLLTVTAWEIADDVPPFTYSVAVHLLDDTGALVAQSDHGLPPAGRACRAAALDLTSLPPGRYELTLGVYAWETGDRLPLDDTDSNHLSLGWIERE